VQLTLSPDSPVMPHFTGLASPFVCAVVVRFMFLSDVPFADVSWIPLPVLFWIVPPEPAVVPTPVTVSPPLEPVVFSTTPFTPPFEEMLWNVRPLPPMVVFETFSAVPLVDVMVLVAPVMLSVPPPVAVKPALAPELMVTFAKSKVEFIFIPFWFRPTLNFRFFVPAFVVLPMWFVQQFLEMKFSEAGSGVAFSAHVGGFIFGAAFALILKVTQVEEKHIAPAIQKEISWEIDPRIAAAMMARDNFDFDSAKKAIEPVLREKPSDIEALRTVVDIARASEDAAMIDNYGSRLLSRLAETKDTDAAIALIQDITVQIDPSLTPKFTGRAAQLVERSGDRDWAMLLYEKSLKADPFGANAVVSLVKMGSIRKSQGDVKGARTAFEEARAHPKCTPEWASTISARLIELER